MLLRKVASALSTIAVAVTFNFVLFRLAPGSPADNFARVSYGGAAMQRAITRQFGLDRPLVDQYFSYLKQLMHGNLGVSFATGTPVARSILQSLLNTIPMVFMGVVIAMILGLVVGVVSAWRRGGVGDQLNMAVGLVLYSLPAQWLGLMLIAGFVGILPVNGMSNSFLVHPSMLTRVGDELRHMVLPSATLAITAYGYFALVTRSAMLEVLGEDYVLLARAKGFSRPRILVSCALRNALLPLIALAGLSIGTILGGAVLIETVFSWPGIGRAIYQAVSQRDYPMLQGAFLVFTVGVVMCNLAAELLYVRLDPRVRV
jgi:ABC-type dipeptide/oligopeptide/nickel transport system permease component